MKILEINPYYGIAGNMFIAALLDAGADSATFWNALNTLDLGYSWKASSEIVSKNSIHARNFYVKWDKKIPEHENMHISCGHEKHRSFKNIVSIISASKLPEIVKKNAKGVFFLLAEAEAKVHNKTVDNIHFHELGSIDSIVDICGVCLALHILDIGKIVCSDITIGSGTITCAHGILPIPAPATAILLQGMPVTRGDIKKEMTTPTGAALLKYFVTEFNTNIKGKLITSGYGAGTRTFPDRPNILITNIFLTDDSNTKNLDCNEEEICILETDMDDITPMLLAGLSEELLSLGALDVLTIPVMMKKGRSAFTLRVLCKPFDKEKMVKYIFESSPTLGIRFRYEKRYTLNRKFVRKNTSYGEVIIKSGYWRNVEKSIKSSPEYETCVKIAKKNGISVEKVYSTAAREINL